MADKTVNVNIKYNVDTSQIQRAQAASQAAQRATDNLRKATDEYGKASAHANKTAQDALKKTSQNVDTLAKDFNGLYTSIRAIVTAGLAKELIDATLNMARLSGQVDGVTRAFNRIPNATLLLEDLRRATHGTVTDLNLMQKTLQAQNFKIPLQNLGTLLEFAATKAQQTGQEVNHLVDYIVSGIGYRSIRRLDDLGFTANRMKEALGGVTLQAASMGEVMNAVTKLMNEDLQKTGGYAETAATDVGKLETAIHELNVEVSQVGTNRGVIKFFTDVVTVTRQAIKAGLDYADVALIFTNPSAFAARKVLQAGEVATQEKLLDLANEQALAFTKRNSLADKDQQLANTDKELFNLAKTIAMYSEDQKNRKERAETLKNEINDLEKRNKSLIGFQKLTTDEAKQIKEKKQELESITSTNGTLDKSKQIVEEVVKLLVDYRNTLAVGGEPPELLGLIDATEESISNLKDALGSAKTAEEIATINSELGVLEVRLKRLKEINTGADIKFFDKDGNGPAGTINSKNNEKILKEQNRIYSETLSKDLQKQLDEALKNVKVDFTPTQKNYDLALTDLQEAFEQNRDAIINSSLDGAQFIIDETFKREVDGYSMRIKLLRDFYDEQINLAGDNERAKKELRIREEREVQQLEKKRADREKQAIKAGIVANTALSIIKIFAGEGTYVDKIIRAAIMAGQGATQYAVASKARYYAKGEINIKGPGTETSDSIPAMLSKGESVMTAKQTREAFGILTDIRAGRLNDKIIKQITTGGGVQVGFNDERIVDAIKKQPQPPDYVDKGRQIYKVFTTQEGHKRYIRSKAI